MDDKETLNIHNTLEYAYCKKEALELASKTLSANAFKLWVLLIEKGYPYFGGETFYKEIPMVESDIDDAFEELISTGYIDATHKPVSVYEFPQEMRGADEIRKLGF